MTLNSHATATFLRSVTGLSRWSLGVRLAMDGYRPVRKNRQNHVGDKPQSFEKSVCTLFIRLILRSEIEDTQSSRSYGVCG